MTPTTCKHPHCDKLAHPADGYCTRCAEWLALPHELIRQGDECSCRKEVAI